MSIPEKTDGRGRPPRFGIVSNFKMTAIDIDRVALTVAKMLPGRTLRDAYILHSAAYYATRGSSADDESVSVVLAHPKVRPSYSQFRYWASKILRAGMP